jgi:hypothetical protein
MAMDIHVIVSPGLHHTVNVLKAALLAAWPQAHVAAVPAGIARHPHPYRPP